MEVSYFKDLAADRWDMLSLVIITSSIPFHFDTL